MGPIKQTAIVLGMASLYSLAGSRWAPLLSLGLTLFIASFLGLAMTTLAIAGETLSKAVSGWLILAIQFVCVCLNPYEIKAHAIAVPLGLGLGSLAVFAALHYTTSDLDDED